MIRNSGCLLMMVIAFFLSNAKDVKIENDYIAVNFLQDNISIVSKNSKEFQISNFKLTGKVDATKKVSLKDNIWGKGTQLVVNHGTIYRTTFTVYESNPFVHVHTTVINKGGKPLDISKLSVGTIHIPINSEHKELNTLGTGGLKPIATAQGSFTYSLLVDPKNRQCVLTGWLTQLQGIGVMEPKLVNEGNTSSYQIKAGLDFGHYRVNAGQERGTDVLLIGFFKNGHEGLALYGDDLAKAYNIKLPSKPNVYCTWYHRDLSGSGASTEKDIFANAVFSEQTLAPFGLNVFQIDDHWQSSMIDGLTYNTKKEDMKIKLGGGPIKTFVESNFNFPSGMEYTAKRLNQRGFTAGIWFMPFSGDIHHPYFNKEIFAKNLDSGLPYEAKKWSGTCIDATNPEGEKFLRQRFKTIYDWGYRYFKIDGLHTGAPSENIYVNRSYDGKPIFGNAEIYNKDLTFVQAFRKGMSILRKEAPEAFLIGCTVTQNMLAFGASFGMVDAMRVGPDNDAARNGDWKNVIKGADYAGNLYFLNNKVWYNDPDAYYERESNPIEKARWMVSWQSISGALSITSMQYEKLSTERLDLIKRGLPTHNYNAFPADLFENEKPNIWMVNNDRMHVAGLFNWKEDKETTINYSLDKLGLNKDINYQVFDFWDNKYLGTMKGNLTTVLKPGSCQVLALRAVKQYPQVISTSRHITQGLIDVTTETWDAAAKTLSGKSKVVANDQYELRIVLPKGYSSPKSAICNGKNMNITTEGAIVRVAYTPINTAEVKWELKF